MSIRFASLLLLLLPLLLTAGRPCPEADRVVLRDSDGTIFPNPDDSCIYCLEPPHERLCISNWIGASNEEALRSRGVTLVVSAIGEPDHRIAGIEYASFQLEDTVQESSFLRVADLVHRKIAAHLASPDVGRVLVHCAAGVSRSSSLLAAHMLWTHPDLSLDEVLRRIRGVRSVARPNARFQRELAVLSDGRPREL